MEAHPEILFNTELENLTGLTKSGDSSVLNNISGWASIVYGITGLNSTVISGNLSGIDALKMAVSYINNNVIDVAIVTAVEGNEAGSIYLQKDFLKLQLSLSLLSRKQWKPIRKYYLIRN